MIIDQLFTQKKLYEFAPGGDDDSNGSDSEELLRRMAAHWWNGNERQMAKVENTLAAMGWEIGQDEGYDDGGVFVVRAGDEHGGSYISWPHEDLELNEATGNATLSENAEDLHVGDPVIITGNGLKFEGATGEISRFGREKRFVVVNLYNHGLHSFHSSDVSFNEYAGSDDEEARMYDAGEFGDDPRNDMDEGRKKKNKKTSRSLGRYFFPGFGYYGSGESGESGGGDGGGESANPSMAEATDPKRDKLERMIWKYFGQIYDYGDDDGLNYLDEQGDLWNQLMDKYNGEIDDIVAQEPLEVLMRAAQELKHIAGDMKYELDEGEYDSRKPFGVRYKVFAGREGRVTTREYWTSSEQKLQRAVAKIEALDNFYEIDGYSYPKEPQGVAEGSLEELANTSLKVKEPKDFVNTNDRKQVTYKVMKFKSGKDTYLINFTVKGAPAFGKKQNWNAVNVAFGVREEQDDYSFGDEINTDLTAKNKNQFLIYSTVINAVRKFITEYNTEIDEIIMQGAGERQEAMYQRFFQSAGKYFPGWHHDGKHSLVRDVPRPTGKKVKEQGVAEGLSDPAKDELIDALQYHSVDDPRELYATLKEIGRGFKTPVAKQIRMALRSLSPDDAYELWETALDIAGVTQDDLDIDNDMDYSQDVAATATGQKKTKHKIHKTIYIESATKGQQIDEVFADQGSGSTDRDNADYMKRRRAAKNTATRGSVTKKPQPYNDPNWIDKLSKEQLDALAGRNRNKDKKDVTEMDKSQTPPGRDTGPREGPEKIAKPITKEKMVKHALDALSKSMAKKDDKKKDVKEGQGGYSISPAELARTAPGIKMAKMAGQSAVAAAKNKLDSLRARNPEQWDKAMQSGSARIHGVPPQFPADAGRLMGDRAEWMKKVKSAPSEWDDTTGSIGMDPLMKKLQTAMVQEGRVKELADDLKTMADAEFMKKYGKAKAAIRADMKRVDEAGISRLGKKDFDFRDGLVGDDQTGYETQNEPELGMFRMGKPVEPNDAATNAFISALTPSQQDNRFTAPAGWRYVEKDEDPARYGSGPAAATSALPNLIYDPQSRTLKSADTPALDLSPKSKYKFDRTTQSQVPADGSGANRNIDNATRDRARAYAAQQNAPAAAAKQKVDWKTIYALNKATIGSNPNVIRPRMQLNMPNGTIYLVQPGDNLSKIAAKQNQINELSTEKLAQYKTAAAADAKKADQEGDFKRGDKRFGGIVKATKKQFDNDAKQVDESRAARRALMAQIVNHR